MKFILILWMIFNLPGNEIVKPDVSVNIEKNVFRVDETFEIELIVTCPKDKNSCCFDTGFFERFQPCQVDISLMEKGNPKNNTNLLSSMNFGVTDETFYLNKGTYIVCRKPIDLKIFHLKPGKYELEFMIPGGRLIPELERKFNKELQTLPYTGEIFARIEITVID